MKRETRQNYTQHAQQAALNEINKSLSQFKNNMPSSEWVEMFEKRHKEIIVRKCQNIKEEN